MTTSTAAQGAPASPASAQAPPHPYLPTRWPAEDGGARRQQHVPGPALAIRPGEYLHVTKRRTLMSTMTVLGPSGEVYLLTHDALRAQLGLTTCAQISRLDPQTLAPIARSPRLAGGRMWPGGMALHGNGDLYVVYGRHAHRLAPDLRPRQSLRLPHDLPYNSFVLTSDGLLVTKNISDTVPARLSVIDPDTLQPVGADIDCPEPSIARLSADGDMIYVVGTRSLMRYRWEAGARRLRLDGDWRHDYTAGTAQTYGWDVVLAAGHAWFMDNGQHRYRTSMIGRGVGRGANRLIRVGLSDASDHDAVEISGAPGGSITNPPLFDLSRNIVVAFDSANRHLRAWRFDPGSRALTPLWHLHPFGAASHMLLYPQSGELVTNDYAGGAEHVAVLDIETGRLITRAKIGGPMQGVVFPSPGHARDFYWCSMSYIARLSVR